MTGSAIAALTLCVAAAALEGLLAGRNARRRLAELRQPPYSPPFILWMGIGLAYYAICFVLLSRLIGSSPSRLRWFALGLLLILIVGNVIWNLVLFRLKNTSSAAVVSVAYAVVAVALEIVLVWADPVSAWVFIPYVIYLSYATWWALALKRLNREVTTCERPGR